MAEAARVSPGNIEIVRRFAADEKRWDALTPTQKRVLTLRYGLLDEPLMTHEQVGVLLRITRNRVRNMERRALACLQLVPADGDHSLDNYLLDALQCRQAGEVNR